MALNTTPRTWVTSEVVTAAEMNTEVRDAVTGIQAAWDTYTPAWTSSGTAPALNNGTIAGRFIRFGKTVMFSITLTMGSTTTFGTGTYFLSLPVTAQASVGTLNAGVWLNDNSGAANNAGTVNLSTSSVVRLLSPTGIVSATAPWTWANLDIIAVNGTYEAA